MTIYWTGIVTATDDFGDWIRNEFVDGRTRQGSWAIMTPKSHVIHGVGLGKGKGQRYRLQDDGRWKKVQ